MIYYMPNTIRLGKDLAIWYLAIHYILLPKSISFKQTGVDINEDPFARVA